MNNKFAISIYLDTRRKKENGKFPVKLRVFSPFPKKAKLYSTKFEFSKDEFSSIYETKKTRAEHKETKLQLIAIEQNAFDIANSLSVFTFEEFEKKLFENRASRTQKTVFDYYQNRIDELKRNGQISTASSYECSLNAIKAFHKKQRLHFVDVTPIYLERFEKFMLSEGKSKTTLSIYLRALRAIFNLAIEDKIIKADSIPFGGEKKYKIPQPKGVKKALTKEQLKTLFNAEPKTPEQQKAKAFWFFSYVCYGMNFKDVLNLKFENIQGDTLYFYRAKTAKTQIEQTPVVLFLNNEAIKTIEQYGNKNGGKDDFVFPIIDPRADPEQQRTQLKNFTRFVNQHFLKFAQSYGINEKVSTYWARHSFATNAIRNGASMEFVSEALNHSSLEVTKGYFAGFPDDHKREFSKKLLDF